MSSSADSGRVDRILDVLLRLAAGDLTARAEVTGAGENLDALAAGINMLAEEIEARVTAVEHAAEELRHQIRERSRQLADALAAVSDTEPEPFDVGAAVEGRYRVVRQLGAGGMGAVHEVVRVTDGQRLALKTLRGRVDRSTMARFAREAQIATELSHPNLVPVLDLGVTQSGMMYLVMELVDGPTLEEERHRFGHSAWALPVLVQIATGLAAIHERGIIHRDLKPANVLLSRGIARIADFGIAALRSDAHERWQVAQSPDMTTPSAGEPTSASLTKTGALMGTPMYMAPELARGAREATPSSDMWAFGVLAYELLSGKPPFLVPPVREAQWRRSWPAPPPIDATGVNPAVVVLVERSLDAQPESRPTVTEWLSVLAS